LGINSFNLNTSVNFKFESIFKKSVEIFLKNKKPLIHYHEKFFTFRSQSEEDMNVEAIEWCSLLLQKPHTLSHTWDVLCKASEREEQSRSEKGREESSFYFACELCENTSS
jgi:hypothetical protein